MSQALRANTSATISAILAGACRIGTDRIRTWMPPWEIPQGSREARRHAHANDCNFCMRITWSAERLENGPTTMQRGGMTTDRRQRPAAPGRRSTRDDEGNASYPRPTRINCDRCRHYLLSDCFACFSCPDSSHRCDLCMRHAGQGTEKVMTEITFCAAPPTAQARGDESSPVIGMVRQQRRGAVDLLGQHQPHQHMWQG